MFKLIRIAILLVVLASVWGTYKIQTNVARDWQGVISVSIIPIMADQKSNTAAFVANVKSRDFDEISAYLEVNAKAYGRDLTSSFDIRLEQMIDSVPPSMPGASSSMLARMFWSLKLRWWAWRNEPNGTSDSQIHLYVLYQSPDREVRLPHSTGLQKGLIGVIHARAQPRDRRLHNVILTHELLHILGASDKYDLTTGRPAFPDGYANPQRQPLLPQQYAEIMARAIPITERKHDVATRLNKTRVGKLTATEIGWLSDP